MSLQQCVKVGIWGFCGENHKIIRELEKQKIIDVQLWITDKPAQDHPNYVDIFGTSQLVSNKNAIFYTKRQLDDSDIYMYMHSRINTFIDMYSRNDIFYQKCEYHSYINTFNILTTYIIREIISKSISLVIFSNMPHEGLDYILYSICKFLKIKTVILSQHPYIPNKIIYTFDREDYGLFSSYFTAKEQEKIAINPSITRDFFYMKHKNRLVYSAIRPLITKNPFIAIKTAYWTISKLYRIKQYINNLRRFSNKADFQKNYCYFALHYQPELTTSGEGIYADQLLAIERLSSILPNDMLIYVKEHPKQTEFMRPPNFFYRLLSIPKVVLVKQETNTYDLIRFSRFTSTITGTVGWESITSLKNTLVFGKPWYRKLPGCFTYKRNFNIQNILYYKTTMDELTKELNIIVNRMWPGIIDPAYKSQYQDYSEKDNIESISCLLNKMINEEPLKD